MATKTTSDYATDLREVGDTSEDELEAQAILDMADYVEGTRPETYPQAVIAEIVSAYIQGRHDGGELQAVIRAMRNARREVGLSN